MKIAVIGSRGIDSDYGGVEKVLAQVCPRLVRRGHEVHVFSEWSSPSVKDVDGVRVIRMPAIPGKYTETLSRSALATLVSLSRDYDVINFCAEGPGLFTALARLGMRRTVVSIHGLDWRNQKWPTFGKFALCTAEAIAVRFADRITVVSRSLERYFRDTYGLEPIYIPHGITRQTSADPSPLHQWGLEPRRYLLFAGRLVPDKGCHDLITAFNGLKTDLKLVIAGDSRYEEPYVRALHGLVANPGRVIFTGPISRDHLQSLIGHAYLFILPSQVEGQSPALLDAVGHGKAAVVSDLPENIEVVGPDAFTFTAGDAADLKRVLSWLLHDEGAVLAMEQRAGNTAASRVCWDSIAHHYERVFQSVL